MASSETKLAEQIERAIPTEYAGNLVGMTVTADLDGVALRVWRHPHYAGQRGYWSNGADPSKIDVREGALLTVRSNGPDTNSSWEWTRCYRVQQGKLVHVTMEEAI